MTGNHLINVLPAPSSLRPPPPKACQKRSKQPNSPPLLTNVPAFSTKVLGGFLYLKDGLSHAEREERRFLQERKQTLWTMMRIADSREQWETAARELDTLEGNDRWKDDISSGDYNPALLKIRLRELDDARTKGDLRAMMYLVRTALSRDLGGMGNMDLYRHS